MPCHWGGGLAILIANSALLVPGEPLKLYNDLAGYTGCLERLLYKERVVFPLGIIVTQYMH